MKSTILKSTISYFIIKYKFGTNNLSNCSREELILGNDLQSIFETFFSFELSFPSTKVKQY